MWELILTIVKVALELWRNRSDPQTARLRAAAIATRELNDNLQTFDEALAKNDASELSSHFELLRRRVSKATGGSNSGQPGAPPDPE